MLQGLQAVSKHLAEDNWIQNPVLGRERWASDHMEGRMRRRGVKQLRDFCYSVLYLRDTRYKLFIYLNKNKLKYSKNLLIEYFTIQREALFEA